MITMCFNNQVFSLLYEADEEVSYLHLHFGMQMYLRLLQDKHITLCQCQTFY